MPSPTSSRPTIAVLTHTHPSITRGGAEISAYALHRGLKELGYHSILVATCPHALVPRAALEDDEYLIEYAPSDYDSFYHVASPDTVIQMRNVLDEAGVDVVMAHHFLFVGLNTIRAMTDLGIKVCLTLHEFLALCYNHGQMLTTGNALCRQSTPARCGACFPAVPPTRFAARQRFVLESVAGVTAFISPSHFLAGRAIEWGMPADRMHVVENGLLGKAAVVAERQLPAPSTGRSTPTAAPLLRRLGKTRTAGTAAPADAPRPMVVGYFGQLNPFKGLDVILDAAEQLTRVAAQRPIEIRIHGTVVGLSPEVQARMDAAVAARVIDYRGPYDNSDVDRLMSACDYILMASRWWENSPVVIQEAFAAQRPLIVPGHGGMAEKVQDGVAGFHFKAADGASLAEVLRHAADTDAATFQFPPVQSAADMAQAYLDVLASAGPGATGRAALPLVA